MDVKGIKWFGNVYQKFETMCLEVEEAVCQDTVKYVENQVQTVGASVKKFYAEVVDDLLSPSLMDPVKMNSLSCTGAHKKAKMGIKDEPKRQLFEDRNATTKMDKNPTYAPSLDRFSNTDPAVPCNPVSSATASKSLGLLPKKVNLVIKRKPKTVIQNSSEVPEETDPSASVPKESVTYGALKIESIEAPTDLNFEQQLDPDAVSRDSKETRWNKTVGGNQEDFKLNLIDDSSVNPAKKIISAGTGTCHPKDSSVGRSSENEVVYKSMHHTDAVNDYPNVPPSESFSVPNEAGTHEGSFADGDTKNTDAFGSNNPHSEDWTSETEATDGWNIETITSDDDDDDDDDDDNNDSVEAGGEIIEINFKNNTALEESCIIVDRDNLPICSHKEPKHKSYKKKFREAFSSRGKSTIKKEYRQLAALYESTSCLELEQHGGAASSSLHASSSTTEERKLKSIAAQLCDSEWEIL